MNNTTFLIAGLISILSGFVIGIVPMIGVVCVLVLVDLGTGIWAAIKTNERIESKKMRKTTYKLLAYFTIIVLCHSIDVFITSAFKLAVFTSSFIALNELYSVIENYSRITGNDIIAKMQEHISDAISKHKIKKEE